MSLARKLHVEIINTVFFGRVLENYNPNKPIRVGTRNPLVRRCVRANRGVTLKITVDVSLCRLLRPMFTSVLFACNSRSVT